MATVTLTYDARNGFAKKTMDYILSLGIFEVEETKQGLGRVDAKKEKFVKNFKKALKQADQIKKEIKEGKRKGLTIDEFLNEI